MPEPDPEPPRRPVEGGALDEEGHVPDEGRPPTTDEPVESGSLEDEDEAGPPAA